MLHTKFRRNKLLLGSTQNLALIGQEVWEKMFEIVKECMAEHGYTISSPGEPLALVS